MQQQAGAATSPRRAAERLGGRGIVTVTRGRPLVRLGHPRESSAGGENRRPRTSCRALARSPASAWTPGTPATHPSGGKLAGLRVVQAAPDVAPRDLLHIIGVDEAQASLGGDHDPVEYIELGHRDARATRVPICVSGSCSVPGSRAQPPGRK